MKQEVFEADRSTLRDGLIRCAKVIGGAAVVGMAGYAQSRGMQEVIPIDQSAQGLLDIVVTTTGVALGGSIAALASER